MKYSLIQALLENSADSKGSPAQQVFADHLRDIDIAPKQPNTRDWVKQVVQMCGSSYNPIRQLALQMWDDMANASWMVYSCPEAPTANLIRPALDCLMPWFEDTEESVDQEHRDLLQAIYLWCQQHKSTADIKNLRRLCQRGRHVDFVQSAIRDLADGILYPKQASIWSSQVIDRACEHSEAVRNSSAHIVRRYIPDPGKASGAMRESHLREGHTDLVSVLQNFASWIVSKGRRKETAIQYATEVAEIIKLTGSDDAIAVEEMIRSLPDDVRSTLTTKGTIRKKRYITAWNAFQKFRRQGTMSHKAKVAEASHDLVYLMGQFLTEQLGVSTGTPERYDGSRRQDMGDQPFRSSPGKPKVREGKRDDGSGTYGHDKPEFRGSYVGQTVSGEQKKGKPKFIPIVDKETGEETSLPVRSKDVQCYWTWDGEQWLTDEAWKAKFASRKPGGFKKPPGMKLK